MTPNLVDPFELPDKIGVPCSTTSTSGLFFHPQKHNNIYAEDPCATNTLCLANMVKFLNCAPGDQGDKAGQSDNDSE